ncbi:hypothetical protein AAG906_017548 [Vitis piasezkii]
MLCERYTRLRSRRGQRRISFHSCKFTAAKEQMLGICQKRISRASNNTKIWAMLWIRPLPTSQVSFINSKFNQYAPENLKDHTPNNKLFDEDGNFLKFTLILDTGSSITWTQCKPCVRCLKAFRRHFDPSTSLTYSLGSCIPTVEDTYNMTYGDKSTSGGNFGCDTLILEPSDVNNKGDFGSGVDGMLGLGQGQLSTLLSPEEDSIGSLLFGEKATSQSSSLKFTSLRSRYYFVKLLDISVGNKRLNTPTPCLHHRSYNGLVNCHHLLASTSLFSTQSAFKKAMAKYPLSNGRRKKGDILDTCYNLSGRKDVLLPEIVLHFGDGADVRLNGKRVIWGNDASRLCLAFAGNSELTIIGNRQQVSLTVLYDIQGGRIGFGGNGCSK